MCLDCTRQALHEADAEKAVEVNEEALQEELRQAQDALVRCREQQAYLQADFENFRRNITKERSEWTTAARVSIVRDLLPVVDNFERAIQDLAAAQAVDAVNSARFQGIQLIHKELLGCFERWQVEPIEATSFDPRVHEAVAQVPASDVHAAGSIVEVLQKGYRCQGVVVRPARVVVAQ